MYYCSYASNYTAMCVHVPDCLLECCGCFFFFWEPRLVIEHHGCGRRTHFHSLNMACMQSTSIVPRLSVWFQVHHNSLQMLDRNHAVSMYSWWRLLTPTWLWVVTSITSPLPSACVYTCQCVCWDPTCPYWLQTKPQHPPYKVALRHSPSSHVPLAKLHMLIIVMYVYSHSYKYSR